MSYYSEHEYKASSEGAPWLTRLAYSRWFKDVPGKILDVGCATGNFIANDPARIEGVDIDEDGLEIAKKRGFRVRKGDASRGLPEFADASLGGIYAKHVIEHMQAPIDFLKEAKRVLAPGGTLIVTTPNCPYALTRMFYDDYTHVRPFTAKSLRMIALDAGFKDFTITQDFRCFPGLGRIMRLTGISPERVRRIQALFGIQGLSLILKARKGA